MNAFIKKIFSSSRSTQSIVIILFIGAYLRLWRIREYMTFLGDEGRDVIVVRKMITELDITFLGPTASVGGFFLGPIYYYLMTPFLWLFGMDPVGPAVMVALFGIATIYLVYIAGRELFSTQAGLFAASLYALSPLVIAHSRSSWNPNILPFFSVLYILSLYNASVTKQRRWYFVVGICLGVGVQLHYLYTFLIPVGILYMFLYARSTLLLKHYLYTVLGMLAVLGPFLAFEIKNRFPNTVTILKFITAGNEVGAEGDALSIVTDVLFRLFARLVFYYPPAEQITIATYNIQWWWRLGVVIMLATAVGLLIKRVYCNTQKKDVLVMLWLLFCVGLFSFYQREIYDYYFVTMFALPFLLVSDTLAYLLKYRYLKYVSFGIFGGLLILNWQGRPFVNPPNNQIENVERIASDILDAADGQLYNFALLTSGNSDHAYRYFLELWDHAPTTIYIPQIDPARNSVTDQLIVLCEFSTCQPLGHPLWEIAGFGPAEIESQKDIGLGMKVFKLVHAQAKMVQ
jgi:4-amino-4-deoxy-L-arabinose transferase-like glycosyltransferase